ncbi:hypothetical protein [Cohnella hashimotonis]|uniref:Uncharacterized protein n=1 Tax=Cohnella hashimotonis TaxID=2826895 RepID=A0ABT6TA94_9BACL|nr:hypothetical protein [Cohnella hashimotonis]MDI4643751.1 hypothetical protein [Cohnella hashimotonis]
MLIDIRANATPEDSRTHVRFPFKLDEPACAVGIHFEYSPKCLDDDSRARELLEQSFEKYVLPEQLALAKERLDRHLPLKNLITLSVDDPAGYRGACHRHDPVQSLWISEHDASPGLMKGKIAAGEWTITLSVHAVVTERCAYRLQVWAADEVEKGEQP